MLLEQINVCSTLVRRFYVASDNSKESVLAWFLVDNTSPHIPAGCQEIMLPDKLLPE